MLPAHDDGPCWKWSDGQAFLADHSTNTVEGHMLRADNNFGSSYSNTAITYSPLLMTDQTGCVRFFYYAEEGTDAELRVYYVEYDADGFGDLVSTLH
ncbi:hypothetical protein E2C01_092536 [Portunus trituberculatus]|uniref:MAM domain-containing protein n=1 Tax=Portunus trituberculatus TaxID=210409 RepID=A0A5B7JM79_PORTR|nr:hypothetical protein [Portunus trituberculatus]